MVAWSWSPRQDAVEDGLVLGNGQRQAARRDDQPAGAVEIGAGRIDDALDLGEAHRAEDDVVEIDIDLVEGLGIVALGGLALGGHIGVQRLDQVGVVAADQHAQGLGFEPLADQHVFADIGDAHQRDGRAALRRDIDQALDLQPRQRLAHRKARHAQFGRRWRLVDDAAGRQGQGDDGMADGVW